MITQKQVKELEFKLSEREVALKTLKDRLSLVNHDSTTQVGDDLIMCSYTRQ